MCYDWEYLLYIPNHDYIYIKNIPNQDEEY